MEPDGGQVGESPLALRFYAGHYAEIVGDSFDLDHAIDDRDLAFVVGALTFLDRVDEAAGLFEGWLAKAAAPSLRTIVAARFFLGLAAARAGYFDRAFPLLVTEAFRVRHDADPWVRSFAFQSLACHCYFTGRYPWAARNALRALQAAHEAKFLYVAMLGTDMRGHSLVQIGQLHRGVAMLEQAGKQARRLGLVNNQFAIETSIATYTTRFDPHVEAVEHIEALLRRRAHDSYSRRALLTESAVQYALRGRRSDAIEALEDADRDALRGDTRRGKVVTLLARIWVTRWQYGLAACLPLIDQARELVDVRDIAFRAQLLGLEVASLRAMGTDRAREEAVLAALREMWRTTHHFTAKAALVQLCADARVSAFDEDAVTPLLRAVVQRDTTMLSRIIALGFYGAIPELLGLTPARRIIWIPSENLMLLEDRGDVVVRARPPRWCPVLLQLLAGGQGTKEHIVQQMWGLRVYHPQVHDPPVRTTIHRLRSFLAPYASWITSRDGVYAAIVPFHVANVGAPTAEAAMPVGPVWEEGRVPPIEVPRPARANEPRGSDVRDLVLARLDDVDEASVPQLARALELSASTVLRALRELVDDRSVERRGFARATRYRRVVAR